MFGKDSPLVNAVTNKLKEATLVPLKELHPFVQSAHKELKDAFPNSGKQLDLFFIYFNNKYVIRLWCTTNTHSPVTCLVAATHHRCGISINTWTTPNCCTGPTHLLRATTSGLKLTSQALSFVRMARYVLVLNDSVTYSLSLQLTFSVFLTLLKEYAEHVHSQHIYLEAHPNSSQVTALEHLRQVRRFLTEHDVLVRFPIHFRTHNGSSSSADSVWRCSPQLTPHQGLLQEVRVHSIT